MIHPFNIRQLIVIFYIAIGIYWVIQHSVKRNHFNMSYALGGLIWPLMLWFNFLISILEYHADKKKAKKIKSRPNFFETYKGQVHPELQDRIKRRRKKAPKRFK